MQLKNAIKTKKKIKFRNTKKSKSKSKSKQYEQSKIEENEENEKTSYNSNYYTLTIDPKYFGQSDSKSLSKSNHHDNSVSDHEDGNRVYTCESNIQINDARVDETAKSGDQFNHNKNTKKDKNTANVENLEFQSVVSEW